MSDEEKNDHAWFRERIAAELAGGLDEAERVRFEAHAKECESCAAELRSSKEMERHMSGLFALPSPGLEDRIIGSLRDARDHWRMRIHIHPAVRRAAVAVAAVIVLGGFGYVVSDQLEHFESAGRVKVASNLRQIGQRLDDYSDESVGRSSRATSVVGYPVSSATGKGLTLNKTLGTEFAAVTDSERQTGGERRAGVLYWDVSQTAGAGRVAKGGEKIDAGRTNQGLVLDGAQPTNAPADAKRAVVKTDGDSDWYAGAKANRAGNYSYFRPVQLGEREHKEGIEVVRAGVVALATGADAAPPPAAAPPAEASGAPKANSSVVVGDKPQQVQPAPAAADSRKIIRNGQVEFEVDRFDAAYAQVIKLTSEAGGYVSTTDSEKLPNGKVKGVVILRVPPERLDTLVLQLRGIGDLKMQKLDANDVTKQYTDLESGLKAARAMEERLLAIIKEGKGQIKDLLAAEKELGVWREKIEKTVGEMRYFDNLVSMSTLQVSLFERDIKTPAAAQQTETIDAGMEAPDVEKARADALKAIEEAKGRVIQSDLKRYDAGQFGATIVAEVPPDNAGPLLDRLKQIGKVARLDIQRKQTTDPNADSSAPLRVDKKPTRLNLSLYNLANVAPRVSSTLNLASDDVEKAYRAILERVKKTEGRILASNLATNKPEQTTGTINFEVPTADADAVVNDLRALGEVIALNVTENPDVNNVTAAKRGFSITLIASAAIPPRQTQALVLESRDVETAMTSLALAATQAGGRIVESNLSKDRDGVTRGTLAFDVPMEKSAGLLDQTKGQGAIRSAQRAENLQAPSGAAAKARIELLIVSPDTIVEAGTGPWATIRNGLATSFKGLMWSLNLIVIGVCFVGPFAAVLWGAWKLITRKGWRNARGLEAHATHP